jgi:UDP-glucuronate 4-epimerase
LPCCRRCGPGWSFTQPQAGVRYSIENPRAYVDSNILGTFNVLEACRAVPPEHLLIASTSSVYGDGHEIPFKESAETSQPLSLYAATKKSAEVIAYSYAHLYRLPITAFRFFTVYGPWGRRIWHCSSLPRRSSRIVKSSCRGGTHVA